MKILPAEQLLNFENEVTQALSDLGITAKINEMDDFMNQNDLKVSITNENTAVTGLVTYTCTVKDQNNTALPNKVVEWYKGTTLIGLDATDSNGISTLSHRVSEADIYDVHAVVKGTHSGDDIRMFVKDKTNILSHAIWSGGEYNESEISSLTKTNVTAVVSDDYSHIGDKSIKLTPTSSGTTHLLRLIDYNLPDESLIGKTALLAMYAFTPNDAVKFSIHCYDENNDRITVESVYSTATSTEQSIMVSKTIPENTVRIRATVDLYLNYSSYIDDIKLFIQ